MCASVFLHSHQSQSNRTSNTISNNNNSKFGNNIKTRLERALYNIIYYIRLLFYIIKTLRVCVCLCVCVFLFHAHTQSLLEFQCARANNKANIHSFTIHSYARYNIGLKSLLIIARRIYWKSQTRLAKHCH